ncbi:related to IQ calmodulin-binding motif protein [Ramularia collo-cygni]|uniref:Related to IQ calmodulin-binding motif protein n=1 Tax=Ramularia collo-cygni TaxID=112498 RepID=A0A2D3UVR9_9PEZI|nr:related to IQ calmodulin-binding motif protein [Ramularia collo-cygni]CZT20811.1 related to IQ calmodulin-binding motif protein [Ramularia collo-cygni]
MAGDRDSARSRIEQLCRSDMSVSAKYAEYPRKSPGEIAEELFGSHHLSTIIAKPANEAGTTTQSRFDWARSCGRFQGTDPSELFLHAFHDALSCIDDDPLASCVSPSLCGTTGYVPLTIIAPLNDQLRHMSNLIVRARKEVLLATNFWKSSGASHFINDAMIDLSRRAGARGERIVFKLMFDRGALKQVFNNHQNVPPAAWQATGVGLPAPEDIPNIDLAIVNFHRPPLGTFHSKFMIVDRQIATCSSHNIQDNDNLEMMSHLEGPIVDSFWETFIISWHNNLEPPLPCRNTPATNEVAPTLQESSFLDLFEPDGRFRLPERPAQEKHAEHMSGSPHYDDSLAGEIYRLQSVLKPEDASLPYVDTIAKHLNAPTKINIKATAPDRADKLNFFPFIPLPSTDPIPMAVVSRKPYASLNTDSLVVPQNEAWLSLIRNAKHDIFIQTPDLNAKPLLPAIITACKRGIPVTYYVCLGYNDGGELLPGQGGTNEMAAHYLYSQLQPEDCQFLKVHYYVAADQDHPIHNNFKQRSCHIKLMIVDQTVAIQGSGNQDTQSWFHSQEVNVMMDSQAVCKAWREGIERNQNTAIYGRAKEDGCWYDSNGKLADGSLGNDAGHFSWAKGMIGTLKKAKGD